MMTDKMIEKFENAGFKRWTNYGKDRLYIDAEGLGLSYSRRNSGSIAYTEWQGEKISNNHAREMINCKMYIDVTTGEAHFNGNSKYVEDVFNVTVEKLMQDETENNAEESAEDKTENEMEDTKMEKRSVSVLTAREIGAELGRMFRATNRDGDLDNGETFLDWSTSDDLGEIYERPARLVTELTVPNPRLRSAIAERIQQSDIDVPRFVALLTRGVEIWQAGYHVDIEEYGTGVMSGYRDAKYGEEVKNEKNN